MKKLVISKTVLSSYLAEKYVEKSFKYIRKIPNGKGGWYYIYPEDLKKPMKALLSFFGLKEEKITSVFEKQKISETYNVTKTNFATHLLEYLSNRSAWNKFFENRLNRDKFKTPEKKIEKKENTEKTEVKEAQIKNNGKVMDKTGQEHNKEAEKKTPQKWNKFIMRKIYSIYNPVPEDSENVSTKENIADVKTAAEKMKVFVGRVTTRKADGSVIMKWRDGREIHTDKRGNVTYDSASITNQAAVDEADKNAESVKESDPTLNTGNTVAQDIQANPVEEHENRSQAMLGNQNAKKYGNLSDEANQIIENNNLNVNADGVVQPTETELKTSKEFFDKNRNQNYKFGKDKYGNNYIQMPGIDGYYYDENGNRVNNAAMIYKRTYHDEYIPEEPNFMTNNSDGERIYLTPEMKGVMESGDTEYHPIDPTYTKPESDSFIDDYIDTLTKEKDISALNHRKGALKFIYEMGKDKGIHIIPVSGIMSNSGPVTHAILPLGESNPMSDNSILIDKSDKKLIDFANHVIETVEPENTPKGQNIQLSAPEKNVLSLAYEFEKRQDPTMSDLWYIEKVKARLPELAAKVDNWEEIKNINFGNTMFKDADAVQEIKDYVSDLAEKENAAETKNGALDNYASSEKDTEIINSKTERAEIYDLAAKNNVEKYKGMSKEDLQKRNKELKAEIDKLPKNSRKAVELDGERYAIMQEYANSNALSEAMKGNQNARKDGIPEDAVIMNPRTYDNAEDQKKYNDALKYHIDFVNHSDTDKGYLEDTIKEYESNPDFDNKPEIDALKDIYKEYIGEDYDSTHGNTISMLGNDNAKGKHNVKPQTTSEMKEEQKKEKKNRKKAGLRNPGNNVGDRVSAIDDVADSWDPNSENYRFKDTGYIAGSRKELASMFIIERAKGGHRIDAREIDFDGLEENPRAAEKLITKSNIFGEVDWEDLKSKGMSGSAAFLIDRIYASAGTKPDESNANARKQYVIALNGLRDRFEECKTVPEVIDTLQEIREEIRGEYVEIKETPEYNKIRDKMKSLRETVYNKKAELDDLADECRKRAELESQKVVEKYINKAKEEKLVRWNTRMSSYNIPEKYKLAYQSESSAAYKKAWEPHSKAIADFKAELISRGVPESAFVEEVRNFGEKKQIEVGWYNLYKLMPESQEYGALSSELDAYVKKMKVAVSLKNPLLEAWKSLGPRFTKILSSDSFAQHRYDCTKGKYDDWEWMQKEVKVTEKTQGKEKKKFQLLVANSITRKGGRDFNITSTADLKKAFNLREVQSGNWVLKDPASAEFHVRNAANAFADLADITGISDDKISLNGRLAMAFGARGTGGFQGAASAHYEPVERVINLTKFKGGGCLGHEWFHSFDNMITSAMTGDDSKSDVYLTNVYHGLSEVNQLLLREYIELKDADSTYTNVYRRGQLKRQLEKKGVDISKVDGAKSTLQFRVQTAFDDLVKAMTTGTSDVKMNLHYESKDYKDMLYNFSDQMIQRYRDSDARYSGSKPHIQVAIVDAGSLEKAVDIINERYAGYSDSKSRKNKNDWLKLAAAYYDRNPSGNKHGNVLRVNSGVKASQFLADAKDLDSSGAAGQKDYWATTHEMAARAFSAYLEDSLEAMGRKNDYLAYASDNKYYSDGKPYPEGEERKRINAAFKKLFEVINSEQAIQKAIDILDNFIIEKSEPRFIIKGGRFLIRK